MSAAYGSVTGLFADTTHGRVTKMPIIEGVLREWALEEMAAEKATLLRLVAAIIEGDVTIISDTVYCSETNYNEMRLVYRRGD